jgi:ADP-ribose pyrophosphatase YjhB (NUDIX family)
MELTPWQRIRTRAFLFSTGLARRMTLGVRGVLIDGDKVFLIRHTYLPGWQFPGGGVEPGENAEHSVGREIVEETGYRLTGRPKLFGLYHQTNETTNRDHVAVYLCPAFEHVRQFRPNAEIAEAGWFHRAELPATVTRPTVQRLAEIFDGAETRAEW